MTPDEHCAETDGEMFTKRQLMLEQAKAESAARSTVRHCTSIGVVMLNLDKSKNIELNALG
ncbi:MAG: hypothetical protein KAG53_06840 [Endozoicomonadaceae bacterium]|nr:hypothetical protein [Endozoicomonadaceae bacterium]